MRLVLLCLLLASCAFDPTIVRNSGIRRAAGAKLSVCLRENPADPKSCLPENQVYCLSQGLEKNCGIDDATNMAFDKKVGNR